MELDRLIQEKRSQLKDAFAAYQKTREALAQARRYLSELLQSSGGEPESFAPEAVHHMKAEIQRFESEERNSSTRFNAISKELAQLHREKHGEWHFTWRGPRL